MVLFCRASPPTHTISVNTHIKETNFTQDMPVALLVLLEELHRNYCTNILSHIISC